MTLKNLIADKKKVDKNVNRLKKRGYLKTADREISLDNDWILFIKSHTKQTELAKGISVATKLIEDEIKFLNRIIYYGTVKQDRMIENRIKYLKSLLATEVSSEEQKQ